MKYIRKLCQVSVITTVQNGTINQQTVSTPAQSLSTTRLQNDNERVCVCVCAWNTCNMYALRCSKSCNHKIQHAKKQIAAQKRKSRWAWASIKIPRKQARELPPSRRCVSITLRGLFCNATTKHEAHSINPSILSARKQWDKWRFCAVLVCVPFGRFPVIFPLRTIRHTSVGLSGRNWPRCAQQATLVRYLKMQYDTVS